MILAADPPLDELGRGDSPFEQLYVLYAASVFSYAARRLGRDNAEDVTAQVFMQAVESWHRYDPQKGSVKTWLFAIATNEIRKHSAREMRIAELHRRSGVDPIPPDPGSIIESRLVAEENWAKVSAVLETVSAVDRDVLLLHCWAGMSIDDVAATLGISTGTAGSKLNRVRRKLRKQVGDLSSDGGDA